MAKKVLSGMDALQHDPHDVFIGDKNPRTLHVILIGAVGHPKYNPFDSPFMPVIYHTEFAHAMFATKGIEAVEYGRQLVKANSDDAISLHNIFTYDNTVDPAKQVPQEVKSAAGKAWVTFVRRVRSAWTYEDYALFTEKARPIDAEVAKAFEDLAVAAGTYTQLKKGFPHRTDEIEMKALKEIGYVYHYLKSGGVLERAEARRILNEIAADAKLSQPVRDTASLKLAKGDLHVAWKKNFETMKPNTWFSPGVKRLFGKV